MEDHNTRCPYCKSLIGKDEEKCGYCGEPLVNNPKPPAPSAAQYTTSENQYTRPQDNDAAQQQPREPRPNSHLAGAILVTLFCCQIFGIVSIVFAAQVDTAYNRGDVQEAKRLSKQAMTWINVSLISGLVFGLLYVILIVTGVVAGI